MEAIKGILGCEHWKAQKMASSIKFSFLDNPARCSSPAMQRTLAAIFQRLTIFVVPSSG